ncbi:hypothetical protein [Actinoplanes palleronii]|nr:hypothetical protein [Actinoplanes palleronii]
MHITKVLWQHSGALIGSRADLLRLGALFRLAATSPHSLVYLPLRENVRSEAVTYWDAGQGLADLVIGRSDTALRPSAWPILRASVRRGLKVGALATVRTPAPRPRPEERQPASEWERERHPLRATEHADTLLLSGSARALHEVGDELTWCGEQVALNSEIHRFGGPALLSQVNGPARRAGRRDASWHFMVLAEDHLFHRDR